MQTLYMGIRPRLIGFISLTTLLCSLMICSCANGQEEKEDSYKLVDVQHFDCNVYMMIFKSTDEKNRCSFRMAQSGPCDSLTLEQFLEYYKVFLRGNKNSILRNPNDRFIFDCYRKVDLSKQVNIDKILALTKAELNVNVGVKEKSNDGVMIEVLAAP